MRSEFKDDKTEENLKKFNDKMIKAKQRYEKILLEKVKNSELRSYTVAKIRSNIKKKNEEYSEKQLNYLVELNKSIMRVRDKKNENYINNNSKINRSFSPNIKINKTFEEKDVNELELELSLKEKKINEKIQNIKTKYELISSIKKEKYRLAITDIMEKKEFQNKLKFLNKSRILSKHLRTTKALESRKNIGLKNQQIVREKDYWLSEQKVSNKKNMEKELGNIEFKESVLITNNNYLLSDKK